MARWVAVLALVACGGHSTVSAYGPCTVGDVCATGTVCAAVTVSGGTGAQCTTSCVESSDCPGGSNGYCYKSQCYLGCQSACPGTLTCIQDAGSGCPEGLACAFVGNLNDQTGQPYVPSQLCLPQ